MKFTRTAIVVFGLTVLAQAGLVNAQIIVRPGFPVYRHPLWRPVVVPAGDYLRGAAAYRHSTADLIRAKGEYEQRQAFAKEQQLRNRRLRRKVWAEERETSRRVLAERVNAIRDTGIRRRINKFVAAPNATDIRNGSALNFLMQQVTVTEDDYELGRETLSTSELAAISIRTAEGRNVSLGSGPFDPSGRVVWPEVLLHGPYTIQRRKIDATIAAAFDGADADTIDRVLESESRQLVNTALRVGGSRHWSIAKSFTANLHSALASSTDGTIDDVRNVASLGELLGRMQSHDMSFARTDAEGTHVYRRIHGLLVDRFAARGTLEVAAK